MVKELSTEQKLVEAAIQKLGIDPKICRTDQEHKWYLHRGKAQIMVFLRESQLHTKDKKTTVCIIAPIVNLPKDAQQRTQIQQVLLQSNHLLIAESFSISNNTVYLSTAALFEDCTEKNLSSKMDSLSYYAQMFVQRFNKKEE